MKSIELISVPMSEINRIMSTESMRYAWALAKTSAKKFGGAAKDFFNESLRQAWEFVRKIFKVKRVTSAIMQRVNNLPNYSATEYVSNKTGERRIHIKNGNHFAGYFIIGEFGAIIDRTSIKLPRLDRINLLATCVNI